MSILVVTSFNRLGEAQQVFDSLAQLKRASQSGLDALMITKYDDDSVVGAQLGGGKANLPVIDSADNAAGSEAPNRALLASVLGSMSRGTSSLFLTVGDTESSVVILTLLLLILPGKRNGDPASAHQNDHQDDNLNRILYNYQTTVSNLDRLDHNATETEVDDAFSAVESAYAALMSSFQAAAGTGEREK